MNPLMNRRNFIKASLAFAGAGAVSCSPYVIWSNRVCVTREALHLPYPLPSGRPRFRIVAVCDIHAPSFYGTAEELVGAINAEEPDLFAVVGDSVDLAGNEGLAGIMEGVHARVSKLASLGNWDYWGGLDLNRLRRIYEAGGIDLLVNRSIEVMGMKIVGLDDLIAGAPDFGMVTDGNGKDRGGPVIVLSHCPAGFDRIPAGSRTILLSGHTHGGQVSPFGVVLGTPYGSGPYVSGWYHRGPNSMYVMRGIGNSFVPLRLGARPEILVLDLIGSTA